MQHPIMSETGSALNSRSSMHRVPLIDSDSFKGGARPPENSKQTGAYFESNSRQPLLDGHIVEGEKQEN